MTPANNASDPTSRFSDSEAGSSVDQYSDWEEENSLNGNDRSGYRYVPVRILALTNPDSPTEDDPPIRTTSPNPSREFYFSDMQNTRASTRANNGLTLRFSDSDDGSPVRQSSLDGNDSNGYRYRPASADLALEQDPTLDAAWEKDSIATVKELCQLCDNILCGIAGSYEHVLDRMNSGHGYICWRSRLDSTRIFELHCEVRSFNPEDPHGPQGKLVWILKSESDSGGVEEQH